MRSLVGLAVAQAILLAATPSPTDLSSLLAPPPGTEWFDVGSQTTTLVGQFSSHDYAVFLKAAGTSPGSVETTLNLYGFTRGYGLEWQQRGTDDLLVERVFEFRDSGGANNWFSDLKDGSQHASEYTGPIATPTIPHSFGAILHSGSNYQYRTEFAKGNLMFVVHMDSLTNDLSSAAVAQAAAMYASAPSQSQVPPGAGKAVNDLVRNIEVAAGVLVIALAIIVAVTLLLATRRRAPVAVPVSTAGIVMSPDGAYWWDGVRWRYASSDPPPTAPRSPDGAYWWDGRTWRPISPTG